MKTVSQSQKETENIAKNLAQEIENGDIIALHGDLGAGKTVFARALIRTLINNQKAEVPSPTFTLVQSYDSPIGLISHFDCYRLKDPDEIFEIGWEEAQTEGIIILEWPCRIESLLPKPRLDITIKPLQDDAEYREITINRIE